MVVAPVAAVISSRSRLQKGGMGVLIPSASCTFRQGDADAESWQALKEQGQRNNSSVPTGSTMLPFESWTKWSPEQNVIILECTSGLSLEETYSDVRDSI